MKMSDKNESLEARKCVTPKFRASYANVFVPTAIEEGQPKKYNITMLFDKTADLSELKRAVLYAAKEAWGPDQKKWPAKRRMPFRDGNVEKPDMPEYKDKIFIYASSKERPGIVDQAKQSITEESGDFYSGCFARASLIAFHFKKAGNEGISFALQNLQKWSDGEKLGGKRSAASDFDEIQTEETETVDDLGDDFDL